MPKAFSIFLPPLATANVTTFAVPLPPAAVPVPHDTESEDSPITEKELESFEQLPAEAKYSQFQSQAYEIKQLRRKLRKYDQKSTCNDISHELKQAQSALQASAGIELTDQKCLIENLLRALQKSKLVPGSFQYDRVCAIVRNALSQGSAEGKMETMREEAEYAKLPASPEIREALVGKQDLLQDKSEAERFLLMQANILKGMDYAQFVNSIRLAKSAAL